MSNFEALQAGTVGSAELLRIDDRTGSIVEGHEADIIVGIAIGGDLHGFCGVTDGDILRVELGQVGRYDNLAVIHERRDRIATFDEIADLYYARLQRATRPVK